VPGVFARARKANFRSEIMGMGIGRENQAGSGNCAVQRR
jgi:hypothetical protein